MRNISEDGKTISIHKFEALEQPARKRTKGDRLAIVLDVETTGLSADIDKIIQLAIRPFYFDAETYEVSGIAR